MIELTQEKLQKLFSYKDGAGKFYSKIYHHGKSHHLGVFATAYEANQAYQAAQRELLETYYEG